MSRGALSDRIGGNFAHTPKLELDDVGEPPASAVENFRSIIRAKDRNFKRASPKEDCGRVAELWQDADAQLSDLEIALEIVHRLGCGGAILDRSGCARAVNDILLDMLGILMPAACVRTEPLFEDVRRRLESAVLRVKMEKRSWVHWDSVADRPLMVMQLGNADLGAPTFLVFVDIRSALQPAPATLQRLFGLTIAEARLAAGMAAGFTPKEMAAKTRVSTSTVRSQLGSIFGKTQTHRQAELVSLLARVSIIS